MVKDNSLHYPPQVHCAYTKMMAIEDIMPHPQNPNQHSDRQVKLLADIIHYHGWRAPITVSERSGCIVRGHGRLAAAKYLNLKEVPVDLQNYDSDEAELADLIADNQIAELSTMDTDTLKELLEELEQEDFPLALAGFDAEAYMDLFAIEPDNNDSDDITSVGSDDDGEEHVCPACGHIFYD